MENGGSIGNDALIILKPGNCLQRADDIEYAIRAMSDTSSLLMTPSRKLAAYSFRPSFGSVEKMRLWIFVASNTLIRLDSREYEIQAGSKPVQVWDWEPRSFGHKS
jgi:hypothetical protein